MGSLRSFRWPPFERVILGGVRKPVDQRDLPALERDTALASPAHHRLIHTCRVVAYTLLDHTKSADPKDIALELGLEVRTVANILQSDEFAEILRQATFDQTSKLIARTVDKLAVAIEDADPIKHASILDRILGSLLKVRTSFAKSDAKADEKEAEQQLNTFLNSLQLANARVYSLDPHAKEDAPAAGERPVADPPADARAEDQGGRDFASES